MRWLIDHAELAGHASVGDRLVVRQALNLAGLGADKPTLLSIPSGPRIASAWDARRLAATRYTDCLAAGATHVAPGSVLVALLHLHHVRAHGVDPDAEALTHRLARTVALAFNARQNTTEENPQ